MRNAILTITQTAGNCSNVQKKRRSTNLRCLSIKIMLLFWLSGVIVWEGRAQAPNISYSGPNVYTTGTAITALAPTNNGGTVAIPGYNSSQDIAGTGFSQAQSVVADYAGNIYVADAGNNLVKEIPAGGGTPFSIGSGFSNLGAVAVDGAGNVYVSDGNLLKEIIAGGNSTVTIASGLNPYAITADVAGNVYETDIYSNTVNKFPAGGGNPVAIGTGFSEPVSVVVDAGGNIYVGDVKLLSNQNLYNATIKEIPAGGGQQFIFASGFNYPRGLVFDGGGNLYVGDVLNNVATQNITEIPAGGGNKVIIASGAFVPFGIAIDGAGNLYVADFNSTAIKKIIPDGGYYISPALPAGLGFDYSSGIISGTPLVANPATNYTITAYNSVGSSSATVNIKVNIQAPAVTYKSPWSYNLGTAIAALGPTSSRVAPAGYNSSPVTLGAGFNKPYGVAADAAGNVYVADTYNSVVTKIPAGGGSAVNIGSGLSFPTSVAVDASGNVYVTEQTGVYEIPVAGGGLVSIGSGFNDPTGVAVDAAGNVYVADFGNNAVKRIPVGGSPVIIGSGFNHPAGVAVDAAGNVFVADEGHNAVKKIPVGGGAPVSLGIGTTFSSPNGVAADAEGDVYVADYGNNAVKMIPAGGGSPVSIGSGFITPNGLAADGAGNVYVADYGNNAVKQINPVGGYFIGPFLPPGLSFNKNTGIISGTPDKVSPATNYTVTAYNANGNSSALVNIKVIANDASLKQLTLSTNTTLTRVTGTSDVNYTTSVSPGTGSLTLTPTTDDPMATVTVNGVGVISGSSSGPITLSTDPTTINLAVTAQDGTTIITYAISVTKAGSNDAGLRKLTLSTNTTLARIPGASDVNYTTSVSPGTNSLTVTPTTDDPNATVTVNGTVVTSGSPSGAIALSTDPALISLAVTAQDGTTMTYSINVAKTGSNDASLRRLDLSTHTKLTRVPGASNVNFTTSVSPGTGFLTLTPVTDDPNATVTVNGVGVTSGSPSGQITLGSNPTMINLVVTAQNGATASYSINVAKDGSNDAGLRVLTLNPNSLLTRVSTGPGDVNYTTSVSPGTGSVMLTPTTDDPNATVTVNGVAVTSGSASGAITLNTGPTMIDLVVTAQNGTTMTYSINVVKTGSSDANLKLLVVNTDNILLKRLLSGPADVNYTAYYPVSNSITSLTVTPTTDDANATVTVNGVEVTSGSASDPIALNVGQNTINLVVTAQNGTTIVTYSIAVTRNSANPGLTHQNIIGAQTILNLADSLQLNNDSVKVHQGLSPNGDGINDFLQIDSIAAYPENKLTIINRNGARVYEVQGYDNTSKIFDGHSNITGVMQVPGIYFYVLDYSINGLIKHKTGYIVLKY